MALALNQARARSELRPLQIEHLEGVAQFLASGPGEPHSAATWHERFAHWWDKNPYHEPDGPRGFVVQDGARIGGFYGLIPLGFQIAGEDARVYAGTTWRVDPEHARHALPLLTRVMRTAGGRLLFTWTGDERVARVLRALDWTELERPAALGRRAPTTLLLRTGRLPSRWLRATGPLPGLHARAVAAAMRLRARGLVARRVPRADAALDALWARTRGLRRTTQLRDARFLGWHLFAGRAFPKRLYECGRRGAEQACGVLVTAETASRGTRVASVADLWTDPAAPGAADALVAEAVADATRDGFDAFVVPALTEVLARLAGRRGFLPRRVDLGPEFVFGPADLVREVVRDAGSLGALVGDRYL